MLNELLASLGKIRPEELVNLGGALNLEDQSAVKEAALAGTKHMAWVPNPGPQTDAYLCEADELFYGGQAGGGKTALIHGLARNEHQNTLILKNNYKQAKKMALKELIGKVLKGDRSGWNGSDLRWQGDGRIIEYGGIEYEDDKEKFKGDPHDLICWDEIPDFSESVYDFVNIWNRSTNVGQKCRILACGNPPTKASGLWIVKRWAAWLDPTHPNPAKPGELRWYIKVSDGVFEEVDGPGKYEIKGRMVHSTSRTFIPAALEDNPDLTDSDHYERSLDKLDDDLKDAYRDGIFKTNISDQPRQLISAAWVKAAQDRWTASPPAGVPMCALGVDVAQGGKDANVLAARHDGWYAPLVKIPGKETPLGTDLLGPIMAARRDNAKIILDVGGGYGSDTYKSLIDNNIPVKPHKGAERSHKKSECGLYYFFNYRTEVYYKFKEALNPAQPGGSRIALPLDTTLFADLTSILFTIEKGSNGLMVKLESKEKLVKRIGRSTDCSDPVVNAWSDGDKIENSWGIWEKNKPSGRMQTTAKMSNRRSRRS
jgi:hypothetical protein